MLDASYSETARLIQNGGRAPEPPGGHAHVSQSSATPAASPPRVLWIDDQVTDEDALVYMLRCEGIAVECTVSVADALRSVRAARFDGLVLDLQLPDGSGLDLLQTLRAEGVSTPVLVLTGFGDSKSALTAGRLGVIDFKHKPIMPEEWVNCVRGLIANAQPSTLPNFGSGYRGVPLKNLSALRGRDLPAYLVRTLAAPTLDVIAFVVFADLLRQAVLTPQRARSISLADEVDRAMRRLSLQLHYAERSQGLSGFDVLSRALAQHRRPTAGDVARELRIDPEAFERDVKIETGRSFAEWRSLIAIMLSVRRLATSVEQVSQIAYSLGFNHPSQFDREFDRILGVSPRAFRTLLKRTCDMPLTSLATFW